MNLYGVDVQLSKTFVIPPEEGDVVKIFFDPKHKIDTVTLYRSMGTTLGFVCGLLSVSQIIYALILLKIQRSVSQL